MPDYLVDTKKKTVNLKCSFFRLLEKFVKQRRMTWVQKQTFLPEGRLRVQQRVSRQILQRPSQRNENHEWKAICKECVKSSTYTNLYQRENELQCDFNAQEMETKPEQIKDVLVIKKKKFKY